VAHAVDSVALVRRYLDAMSVRDLDTARDCLAPGFTMTFPGGVVLDTLEALIDWSRMRYSTIAKSDMRFERTDAGNVVWCFGTLSGLWPDGTPFAGIRFIDRFEIEDGRLRDQKVWNDMGEARR
jgi:hypothetical protein